MSSIKDKILSSKLKTKDPDVFAEFYDAYVNKIYRFIYFKVATAEEAEDIAAETFLKIWQHLFENKPIEHLNAFVYQVARNLVIDFYRKKAQQKLVLEENMDAEAMAAIPDPKLAVDKKMELASDVAELEDCLRQMKEEYREVIILKYFDQLNVGEIAKILGKSRGAVRVLAHRALKTLAELMEKKSHEEPRLN